MSRKDRKRRRRDRNVQAPDARRELPPTAETVDMPNRLGPRPSPASQPNAPPGTPSSRGTAVPDSGPDSAPPQMIGPYQILGELGRGGMGVVYRGYDPTLDRPVAIKVLPEHLARDRKLLDRFLREARATARIDHPGIVGAYGADVFGSRAYLAMPLVEGETLDARIERDGVIDEAKSLAIAREVADALQAAHAAKIIHRDIKPANILLDPDGRVRVMDFGLARATPEAAGVLGASITQTGLYLGTPEYSSPEQCETFDLDERTDLYSLGVVLYEMLTGRVPFEARTPLRLFEKIVYEPYRPVIEVNGEVSPAASALLDGLLAKDRNQRYGSAEAVLRELDLVEAGEMPRGPGAYSDGVPPAPPMAPRAPSVVSLRRRRRRAKRAAAAVLILAAVGLVLVAWWWRGHGETRARRERTGANRAGPSLVSPPDRPAGPTIAILDFVNRTGNEQFAWLSVGLADMLITDLGSLDQVQVLSRESVRALTHGAGGSGRATGVPSERALRDGGVSLLFRGEFVHLGPAAGSPNLRIDLKLVNLTGPSGGRVVATTKAQGTEPELFRLVDRLSRGARANLIGVLERPAASKSSTVVAKPKSAIGRALRSDLAGTRESRTSAQMSVEARLFAAIPASGISKAAAAPQRQRKAGDDQGLALVLEKVQSSKFKVQGSRKEKAAQSASDRDEVMVQTERALESETLARAPAPGTAITPSASTPPLAVASPPAEPGRATLGSAVQPATPAPEMGRPRRRATRAANVQKIERKESGSLKVYEKAKAPREGTKLPVATGESPLLRPAPRDMLEAGNEEKSDAEKITAAHEPAGTLKQGKSATVRQDRAASPGEFKARKRQWNRSLRSDVLRPRNKAKVFRGGSGRGIQATRALPPRVQAVKLYYRAAGLLESVDGDLTTQGRARIERAVGMLESSLRLAPGLLPAREALRRAKIRLAAGSGK